MCHLEPKSILVVVVVLGFYVPPTAKFHTETGPRFKVSSERLEKPGIELTTLVYKAVGLTTTPQRLLPKSKQNFGCMYVLESYFCLFDLMLYIHGK